MLSLVSSLNKIAEQLSKLATKHANDRGDSPHVPQLIQKLLDMDKLETAIVGIFAPDGAIVGSGRNLLLNALQGIDLVSGAHAQIGASGPVTVRAGDGISLFANEAGAKVIAAAGKILVQAQSNGLEILAKTNVDIVSTNDWINIRAKHGIRINAGGSELVIDAQGIRGYTGSKYEMHASSHEFLGSQTGSANLARAFPEISKILNQKTWVEVSLVEDLKPVGSARFILTDADGGKHEGQLDQMGFARIEEIPPGHCRLVFPDIGKECDLTA